MAILETDPVTLRLTAGGDIDLANFGFIGGLTAFKQGCEHRLLLVKGEWFNDLDLGVDFDGTIWGKAYDEARAREEFRAAILRTPGALSVPKLQLTLDTATRALTVTWEALAEFSDTAVGGVLPVSV